MSNSENWACGLWSGFFYRKTSQPKSNKDTVDTWSLTALAPKALGVKFHFPWPNTGRDSDSQRSTDRWKLVEIHERNLLWCIFCCSPKIWVKSVFASLSCLHIVPPHKSQNTKASQCFALMLISASYSASHILWDFASWLFSAAYCFFDCFGSFFSLLGKMCRCTLLTGVFP